VAFLRLVCAAECEVIDGQVLRFRTTWCKWLTEAECAWESPMQLQILRS
jgi:hypothetical protein